MVAGFIMSGAFKEGLKYGLMIVAVLLAAAYIYYLVIFLSPESSIFIAR